MPYRTKIFARLALCAFLLPVARGAQNGDTAKPAVFPPVASYALNKTRVFLPRDFAGQIDLLLISFRPEQQTQIDTWMPLAEAFQHTDFNFRWYRLPVSSQENIVFRWWENSSMRSDESDPETWPWIIPLYVDKDSFRHSLQISGERQMVAMLVDKQGRVLWHADGSLTPDKRSSLTAAVTANTVNK